MSSERTKAFSELKENLNNMLDQIEKATPSELASKDNKAFLLGLETSGALLAQSVNNAGLAFRSEPSPSESESEGLSKNIESRAVHFLKSFLLVPQFCGRHFLFEVREVSMSTLKSCISFADALLQLNQMVRKKKQEKLVLHESVLSTVAAVWEKGHDSIQNLPRNNYQASAKFISNQLCLITDAITELDEAKALMDSESVSDDIDELELDEFDLRWSGSDLKVVGPALGLLKTAKNLVKKIGQTVKEIGSQEYSLDDVEERNRNLDNLSDACAKLSPASDDLAAALYPPIEPAEVQTAASTLITISKQLMDKKILVSVLHTPIKSKGEKLSINIQPRPEIPEVGKSESVITDDSKNVVSNWAEFLAKALRHNEEQLDLRLAERGINNLKLAEETTQIF